MRKIISSLLTVTLLFACCTPIRALNRQDLNENLDKISEISGITAEIIDMLNYYGIDSEQINKLYALEQKGQEYFDVEIETSDTLSDLPDDYQAYRVQPKIQTRIFDGNLPQDSYEQAERMDYILRVATENYSHLSQKRFNDYIYYLYMSHYVDNEYYEKNSPNFNSIYASIISKPDVEVYDSYLNAAMGKAFYESLVGIGDILYTGAGVINDTLDAVKTSQKNVRHWLNKVSIMKETVGLFEEFKEVSKRVIDLYTIHYDEATSASAMIDIINTEAEWTLDEEYLKNFTLDLIFALTCSINPLVGILIAEVSAVMTLYVNVFTTYTLAMLGYSWSGRQAERLWIELGFGQRPD